MHTRKEVSEADAAAVLKGGDKAVAAVPVSGPKKAPASSANKSSAKTKDQLKSIQESVERMMLARKARTRFSNRTPCRKENACSS